MKKVVRDEAAFQFHWERPDSYPYAGISIFEGTALQADFRRLDGMQEIMYYRLALKKTKAAYRRCPPKIFRFGIVKKVLI